MFEKELTTYIEEHTSPESEILYRLNRETHLKFMFPRMLSGHTQGKFLEMVSCMIRPERILEIGTFTGYSAICLTAGLQKNGVLHTVEIEPENSDFSAGFFRKAGVSECIVQHTGKALEILPGLDGPFDLVFIDADKENYLNYYKLIFDKVRAGGFILADNALWDGKVVKPFPDHDKETAGIIEFNDFISHDDRVENVILTLRDGVMMIRKK